MLYGFMTEPDRGDAAQGAQAEWKSSSSSSSTNTLGSIYGLIAIGYTMVYGIIGMVNFAHGDLLFMVSAFISLITFLILTTFLGIGSIALALIHRAGGRHAVHLDRELGDRARRPTGPCAARSASPR